MGKYTDQDWGEVYAQLMKNADKLGVSGGNLPEPPKSKDLKEKKKKKKDDKKNPYGKYYGIGGGWYDNGVGSMDVGTSDGGGGE